MTARSLYIALSVAAAIAIGLFGLTRGTWNPFGNGGPELHVFAFSTLVLMATLAAPGRWAWVAAGAFGLGVCLELLQPFVGRQASLEDLSWNLGGIGLGCSLALLGRALVAKK